MRIDIRAAARKGDLAAALVYAVDQLGGIAPKPLTAGPPRLLWQLLLIVSAAGLVISVVRARSRPLPTTIHAYFREFSMSFANLSVALSCLLAGDLLEYGFAVGAPHAISARWLLLAAALIALHQAARGAHRMRQRWRSTQDIYQSIADTRYALDRVSFAYDFGFGVAVAVGLSLANRWLGGNLFFLLCALGLLLIVPYLAGAQWAQNRLLRRLLPVDEPLP